MMLVGRSIGEKWQHNGRPKAKKKEDGEKSSITIGQSKRKRRAEEK